MYIYTYIPADFLTRGKEFEGKEMSCHLKDGGANLYIYMGWNFRTKIQERSYFKEKLFSYEYFRFFDSKIFLFVYIIYNI